MSSHCGRRSHTLLVGMRDPQRQRWVAMMMGTLTQALTNPQTSEQGLSFCAASQISSFFSKIFASLPRRPPSSAETTNREKCQRCLRHAPRCFFSFSSLWAASTLCGSLDRFDLASTWVTLTSKCLLSFQHLTQQSHQITHESIMTCRKLRVLAGFAKNFQISAVLVGKARLIIPASILSFTFRADASSSVTERSL